MEGVEGSGVIGALVITLVVRREEAEPHTVMILRSRPLGRRRFRIEGRNSDEVKENR